MSRLKNAFSLFYKTPVEIYCIKNSSDYSSEAETEFVCSVLADIQPEDGSLLSRDFSLETSDRFKMYCAFDERIKAGHLAKIDGRLYRIVSAAKWNFGIEAVLEGEKYGES